MADKKLTPDQADRFDRMQADLAKLTADFRALQEEVFPGTAAASDVMATLRQDQLFLGAGAIIPGPLPQPPSSP